MNISVHKLTVKEINKAYNEQNKFKIEKETFFVMGQLLMFMSAVFKRQLKAIHIDNDTFQIDEDFIITNRNKKQLLNWLDMLIEEDEFFSDYKFGKLKLDLEEWFYLIGGEYISFTYQTEYLLTPSEVAEKLKV